MKKLYAVNDGEYSGQYVVCITENKELAERIKKIVKTSSDVSEIYLIENRKELKKTRYYYYSVDVKGKAKRKWEEVSFPWDRVDIDNTNKGEFDYIKQFMKDKIKPPNYDYRVITGVSTKDHKHALKDARDRLTKLKAEHAGIT